MGSGKKRKKKDNPLAGSLRARHGKGQRIVNASKDEKIRKAKRRMSDTKAKRGKRRVGPAQRGFISRFGGGPRGWRQGQDNSTPQRKSKPIYECERCGSQHEGNPGVCQTKIDFSICGGRRFFPATQIKPEKLFIPPEVKIQPARTVYRCTNCYTTYKNKPSRCTHSALDGWGYKQLCGNTSFEKITK